jgi:hypothetical protein
MASSLKRSALGALFLVVSATSCSRASANRSCLDLNIPDQFEVNKRSYVLDRKDPGIIVDELSFCSDDAGARTFNFNDKTLTRSLFAGTIQNFRDLKPDEQQETRNVASGALKFVKHQRANSMKEAREGILNRFLAEDPATLAQ